MHCNQSPECGACCDAPHSAICFGQDCQPGTHQRLRNHKWHLSLRQTRGCREQEFHRSTSTKDFKCSYVQPPGPGEALFKKIFLLRPIGVSGSKRKTSSGRALITSCGLLFCIMLNVASVPGASAAPVRHWRALDTSPNFTFWYAASARRSNESSIGVRSVRASCVTDHCTSFKRPCQSPELNWSNRWHNSAFPTFPWVRGLCNNMNGSRQKSFQARISFSTSRLRTASCRASNACLAAKRNLPLNWKGQFWSTAKRVRYTADKSTPSKLSHPFIFFFTRTRGETHKTVTNANSHLEQNARPEQRGLME